MADIVQWKVVYHRRFEDGYTKQNLTKKEIEKIIETIISNPFMGSNIKKLGGTDSSYRLRKGNYRIIYTVDKASQIIYLTDFVPRGDAYKKK